MVTVEAVPADVTLPLRQKVLRPHQTLDELREPDDDTPASTTFAARGPGGEVLATGVVSRRPPPWPDEGGPSWQVRAMAVADGHRGEGLGRLVLDTMLAHVAGAGGGLVWCNARTAARAFYERAGFAVVGDPFELPHIGPHQVMSRAVTTAPS
jgi:GNAT superfamily N-acetyltransferase